MISSVVRLLILLPLYNDWRAAAELLKRIRNERIKAEVLIVNDGSTDSRPDDPEFFRDEVLTPIQVLHLRRNIGHQRAIAIGLVYAYQHCSCTHIVIMDSDGEDRPEDIRRLLAKESKSVTVFASRMRRTESILFRCFYSFYRFLHLLATGIPVRVGNFSLLPFQALESLVVTADLWNHYAAAVFRSGIPRVEVPCVRGVRFEGKSKMNFTSLVAHGFSALSVFADLISVRLLCLTAILLIPCLAAITFMAGGTFMSLLLALLLIQTALLSTGFSFLIINRRSQALFLPLRDCHHFYGRVELL